MMDFGGKNCNGPEVAVSQALHRSLQCYQYCCERIKKLWHLQFFNSSVPQIKLFFRKLFRGSTFAQTLNDEEDLYRSNYHDRGSHCLLGCLLVCRYLRLYRLKAFQFFFLIGMGAKLSLISRFVTHFLICHSFLGFASWTFSRIT